MDAIHDRLEIANSPKVILVIDPADGRILDASAQALAVYGWTRQEILCMRIHEINLMSRDEIRTEMQNAMQVRRNFFHFRHLTKSGDVLRVNVSSIPICRNGREVLLSIIEPSAERPVLPRADVWKLYELSADPLLVLRMTGDAGKGTVLHANRAAVTFIGEDNMDRPLSDSILLYDRSNFEGALNRIVSSYYHEIDLLFKTHRETVVKTVGLTRLNFDADYYVLMQIRPQKGVKLNQLRRSDLHALLDRAIESHMRQHPDSGSFGILRLKDADMMLRLMGKEAYLQAFLAVAQSVVSCLEGQAGYELLDESLVFFQANRPHREEKLRETLKVADARLAESQPFLRTGALCVVTAHADEPYNPDFGLAHKMLALFDTDKPFTRLKIISEKDIRRKRLQQELPAALDRKEFFLEYQPIVNVSTGRIESLEALIRWNHPELGIVRPDEFIPLAEENGSITQIDEWVVREVIATPRPHPVHVNLSAKDLVHEGFRLWLKEALADCGTKLVLELTETSNFELSEDIVTSLNAINATVSIDDFGTGYSSMSRLTALNVSSLKIDKSFVMNSGTDIESASICIGIIRMAKGLNLDVIAEGVETREQLLFLFRNGCHLIQGYVLSRPVPFASLPQLDTSAFRLNAADKYPAGPASEGVLTASMIVELNDEAKFIRVPMSFCRFVGRTQEELRHMVLFDLVPPDHLAQCHANCQTLHDAGHIENAVLHLIGPDGERRPVSIAGRKGVGGDPSVYLYIVPDQTDEEQTRVFQGAQEAYRTLFHEGPLATIVWKHDFEIIDWNREAETTFGWKRAEALGRNLIKLLIRSAFFPEYMDVFHRITTEPSWECVHMAVTQAGKPVICRWEHRMVQDPNGAGHYFITVVKDITEDLFKNERIKHLSYAVEKSGAGIVVTDDQGAILSLNHRFTELTGYGEADLLGQTIGILSRHVQNPGLLAAMGESLGQGGTWEGEFQNQRKDGTLYWCRMTIVPVTSEWNGKLHFLALQWDQSSVREQEEKNALMRTKLVEQDKLATLGSMLAGVTHETFNFMSYVESNLEYVQKATRKMLDGGKVDADELTTAVADTKDGVKKIHDLLLGLKRIARKDERPQVETCDINQEILQIANVLRNEYKYVADFFFTPTGALAHDGYPGLLRQVLMNLIINAAHAIQARATETVGRITVKAERWGPRIHIEVQDDGIGMDEETRCHIFEPFFTTKRAGTGTGLGLSISRDIVEVQYGGRLSCTSTPGVGTTFEVEIPDVVPTGCL